MEFIDTAGNRSGFIYPCPANCGSTGGCDKCMIGVNKIIIELPSIEPIEEKITKEDEKNFYKKVFKTKN